MGWAASYMEAFLTLSRLDWPKECVESISSTLSGVIPDSDRNFFGLIHLSKAVEVRL